MADLLKIKPKTVLDWAERGYLPCIRLGPGKRQMIRFREQSIMEFVAGQEQGKSRQLRKRVASGGRALDCVTPGRDFGLLTSLEDSGK